MALTIEPFTEDRIEDVLAYERELREQEKDTYFWDIDEQYIANVKNSFKDGRFAESFKRKRSGGITCSCRRKWRSKQVLSFAGKHKNSG